MSEDLKQEYDYYLENQERLYADYPGEVIVIKDRQVIGSYDSELEAVERSAEKHALGTFLVQRCEPVGNGQAQTYHSRVVFR